MVLTGKCEDYLGGGTLAENPQKTFQPCYYCIHSKAKSSRGGLPAGISLEPGLRETQAPWQSVHVFLPSLAQCSCPRTRTQ